MKQIRAIGTTLALSCAFATGSAWAAQNVDTSDNASLNDHEISRQVLSDVYQDVAVGPYGVRVKTRDGAVTLTGSVGTERDWKMAEEQAANADGVTSVENNLSVLIR